MPNMKLTMTNDNVGEIVLEAEGKNLTEICMSAIKTHTFLFGEDYLHELLQGLGEMLAVGDGEYVRKDFSDPESDFTLRLIDQ